jgi:hypothetical protein
MLEGADATHASLTTTLAFRFCSPSPSGPVHVADTLKDLDLLAEAKKASLDIHYVSRKETEGVVHGLFKMEAAFIARMKQVRVP